MLLLPCLLLHVVGFTLGARYARFQESWAPNFGGYAIDENGDVILGTKNSVMKLKFEQRRFVARFEVMSSLCALKRGCDDYTQHVVLADGQDFGIDVEANPDLRHVVLSCGTHGGRPRCVVRSKSLLRVVHRNAFLGNFDYLHPLNKTSTANIDPTKKSLVTYHRGEEGGALYYASFISNDTHPIFARYSQGAELTTKIDPKWFNEPKFVSLLAIDSHVYLFFQELILAAPTSSSFDRQPTPRLLSRVARVCANDLGGNKLLLHKHFSTFTKAGITCITPSQTAGVPDYSYDFIDGVAIPHQALTNTDDANRMLYAIFSNDPHGPCSSSAICAYSLNNVDSTFKNSHFVRVDNGHTTQRNVTVFNGAGSCERPRSLYDAHKYNLLREPVHHGPAGPMYTAKCRRYTAVAADRVNDVDVLFLATDDKHFLKMSVIEGKAQLVDSFRIRRNDADITKIEIPPNSNYVLASGADYLLRIPVAQCRRFSDCESCVGSRDPYCGWCPLYNACTSTLACNQPVVNYAGRFETGNLCYPHQKSKNTTRRAKKIKRRKRRK